MDFAASRFEADLSSVPMVAATDPPPPPGVDVDDCLGSTCLKWGQDGELTSVDLRTVLERLCVHDPQACRLLDGDPASA